MPRGLELYWSNSVTTVIIQPHLDTMVFPNFERCGWAAPNVLFTQADRGIKVQCLEPCNCFGLRPKWFQLVGFKHNLLYHRRLHFRANLHTRFNSDLTTAHQVNEMIMSSRPTMIHRVRRLISLMHLNPRAPCFDVAGAMVHNVYVTDDWSNY